MNIYEEELDFINMKDEMEFRPWQQDISDNKWRQQAATAIRKLLAEYDPIRRKFSSDLAINNLAMEIAKQSGKCRITMMPYAMIRQAYKYQSYRLQVVGELKAESYFAVIDEDARLIAVHVPKSPRQLAIEKVIHEALSQLACYMCSKGGKLTPNIREALESFMWKHRYPEKVAPIKIIASSHPLSKTNATEEVLKNSKTIQMQFKNNVLYYHIK